jgi:hypothetical protein
MKIINKIGFLILSGLFLQMLGGCTKALDYGNICTISGTLKDASGNIVAGDVTTTNLMVRVLATGELVTTDLRVLGNGTFQNTKLYQKKYKVWVAGPVTMVGDTLRPDLSVTSTFKQDIVVIPFITVAVPAVAVQPTTTTVSISYALTANSGKTISKRQLYISTNPYPNASTGNAYNYTTQTVTLTTDSGTAAITGLVTGTTYYVRIGAQATGAAGFNYSDQIIIKTL